MTTSYLAQVNNLQSPIVLQISSSKYNITSKKTGFILDNDVFTMGHSVIFDKHNIKDKHNKTNVVYNIEDAFFINTQEDDIVQIFPDGHINILWEKRLTPYDVTLFITNQCNAMCIMCPQPPEKDQYSLLDTNALLLEYLKKQPIKKIGITGGEPTAKMADLTALLKQAHQNFPTSHVDLLTNGKQLSNFKRAKTLALSHPNITFCISFPSDNINDFNEIVGVNIFSHVLRALQNLAILRQEIELRVVVMKQNYNRLLQISEFIFRNFPFVTHIAFMGMEVIGFALDNIDDISVQYSEYNQPLIDAVRYLSHRDMNVSIYNLPYCLVDRRCWRFLKNSISLWKQKYHKKCNTCLKQNHCPGMFATSKINIDNPMPIIDYE
jgi:His-Xaa-Ser system radical SAM maturase HxsC